jgi:hypothetical protein
MATFDDLYPDAPTWFQPPKGDDDDGCIKSEHFRPCWNCGTKTAYIDLGFETYLCSEYCRDVKWAEFFRALRDTDH